MKGSNDIVNSITPSMLDSSQATSSTGPSGPLWIILFRKLRIPALIICILLLGGIVYCKVKNKKVNISLKISFIVSIIIYAGIELMLLARLLFNMAF